jgi:hypothetical protein
VHYQIGDEAVRRLDELMQVVLKEKKVGGKVEVGAEKMVGDLEGDCP